MDLNATIILTHEELKAKTFAIHSLNQEQREIMRVKLEPYVGRTLYARDLKHILHELRQSHELSTIDVDGIANAFFK
jgi:hypothetical protein